MKKNDRRRNDQPSGNLRQDSRRGGGELRNVDMRDNQPNQDFGSGAQEAMGGLITARTEQKSNLMELQEGQEEFPAQG